MIAPDTQLSILVVRLSQIVVTEHQARYPERVWHYVRLLSDPAHQGHHPGLLHVAPCGVNTLTHEPLYTLLDGHHRFCAAVIVGRETLLAVVHVVPPQTSVRELSRETVALADDYETLALLPAVNANGHY